MDFISSEEFERAAVTRDEIRSLEKELVDNQEGGE
jgi:protein-arginine kinase activator protein McsA